MSVSRNRIFARRIAFAMAVCMFQTGHAGDTVRRIATSADGGVPTAFWVSQPVAAGDTIVVSAAHTSPGTLVRYERLSDDDAGDPLHAAAPSETSMSDVVPLQASTRSVKFLPPDPLPGVYAFRMVNPDSGAVGPMTLVNAPDPWFVQGDQGSTASPGGRLRVYGSALGGISGTGKPKAVLVKAGTTDETALVPDPSDVAVDGKYGVSFTVPAGTAPGDYVLYVHNGSGGPAAWTMFSHFGLGADRSIAPTTTHMVTVAAPVAWPARTCRVDPPRGGGLADDDSFDAAFNCARDLDRNGNGTRASWESEGATIALGNGTYVLDRQYAQGFALAIPNHTIIDGGRSSDSELSFPHANGGELFSGTGTFVQQQGFDHNWAQGVFGIRNVRITAPQMTTGAGIVFDHMALADVRSVPFVDNVIMHLGDQGIPQAKGIQASNVSNLRVRDSELFAGFPIYMNDHVHGASVIGSTLTWYNIGLSFRFYSENAAFTGNTLVQMPLPNAPLAVERGFAMPTRDVYYGSNVSRRDPGVTNLPVWGLTFDENEDLYFGNVATTQQNTITLARDVSDTVLRTYAAAGFTAMVVSGTGSGQMRFVTGSDQHRQLTVDRPWDVDLDATSVLAVTGTLGRMLFVNNDYGVPGIQNVFFASSDVIQARNHLSAPEGGIVQQAGEYALDLGYTPGWHFQVLGNWVSQPTAEVVGLSGQAQANRPGGNPPYAWYTDTVTQTNIIRGNVFDGDGEVGLWDSVGNSLIENNYVPSIRLQNASSMKDVLIRSNRTVGGAGSALNVNQALPPDVTVK